MLMRSVETNVLVGIAHLCEVSFKVFERDDYCAAAVIGMERECLLAGVLIAAVFAERGIEEEIDVVVRVVDKPEGRDATRFKPQILHHALGRSEGELAA